MNTIIVVLKHSVVNEVYCILAVIIAHIVMLYLTDGMVDIGKREIDLRPSNYSFVVSASYMHVAITIHGTMIETTPN